MGSINYGPSTSTSHINKTDTSNKCEEKCTRCGKLRHGNISECPAREAKYYKCEVLGHFSAFCSTKAKKRPNRNRSTSSFNKRGRGSKRVNRIKTNYDSGSDHADSIKNVECFKIDNREQLSKGATKDELIECRIGGVILTLLIDSGSKVNIITGTD